MPNCCHLLISWFLSTESNATRKSKNQTNNYDALLLLSLTRIGSIRVRIVNKATCVPYSWRKPLWEHGLRLHNLAHCCKWVSRTEEKSLARIEPIAMPLQLSVCNSEPFPLNIGHCISVVHCWGKSPCWKIYVKTWWMISKSMYMRGPVGSNTWANLRHSSVHRGVRPSKSALFPH